MDWGILQGQDAAVESLRRDISSGRVGGAYIFYGPEGVGKATAAGLFARALECEGEAPPCGACPACEKVGRGVHPDVITVRPEKDKSTGQDRKTIGVGPIREQVLQRAHQRPQEGRRLVFIVDNAHTVTLPAFNSLLKTLEEPSPDTVLIIVTPNLHALPPTVVSRCRRLRFRSLNRAEQREILSANLGEGEADPDRLISLSLGRLGQAFDADSRALAEQRESALEFLEGVSAPPGKADEAALLTMAAAVAGRGGSARRDVLGFLEMILGLLRDILVLEVAPDVLEPWNADVDKALRAIGSRWGVSGLIQALDRVRFAARDVGEINTNPSLTLESLVISLRGTVGAGG